MKPYTVAWTQSALSELAEVWNESNDRNAITKAVYRIDQLLSERPFRSGIPLHEGLWQISISPLRATFDVRVDDRLVEVLQINPKSNST